MPKYYVYEGEPVYFPTASGKKYARFIADNGHLVAAECSKAEYDDAMKEKDKDSVRRQRANEYPAIGDQLDAVMKWLATETEFTVPAELKSLAMACMSVKSRLPIPK